MKIKKNIILVLVALLSASTGFAKSANYKKDVKKETNHDLTLVANCVPATKIIYMEFNNVRARIETGGLWWQDRANTAADYEVPKNSGSYAIFAGGLWMAGTDVNGQLKAAVTLFSPGDYWTGPLNNDGTAEITPEVCSQYDGFNEISRQEVVEFNLYRNALKNDEVEKFFPDGYSVPKSISDWPGDGDVSLNQAAKLAPYVDVNNDNIYDSDDGDYPYYDLTGTADCRAPRQDRSESASRPLFGDLTYWWIFNDKGNLHTVSNAPSIGMEIHAQAFAFATNDAINDMTFYNFELINRSTFTLTDTYFASYVDPDVGNSADDFVGCDVGRGLGFAYNGDELDESVRGQNGYGSSPAAIGIDFFEGPFQDADGINNNYGIMDGEALNGLGYYNQNDEFPDSLIDNERYGMRRFVYYNIGSGTSGDPSLAIHFYNYMRGIWQNGQAMRHGGDGLSTVGVEDVPTAFMFPGKSDPRHWGTTFNNITIVPDNDNWTEDNTGNGQAPNAPGDRRFLQSAGPFTLEPGNVNDITVGVVFAQSETGGRLGSVEDLYSADDKAQALFDNCFKVLDGPDAPDLAIQELDKELILYLSNGDLSNNLNELYEEEDPEIITPDTIKQIIGGSYDNKYRFQGYQIYQLSGDDIDVSNIDNPDVARLIFQCDIADGVSTLTNFEFDEGLQANMPIKKVEDFSGIDEGILHSFRVTEDQFASGAGELVNYKTYYFIAVAYAYNNYKGYLQDAAPDLDNPFSPAFDGQKKPYIASRKNSTGGAIASVSAIPHNYRIEENGTQINSSYGDLVQITRLQGTGNGNNALKLTKGTIDKIMEDKAWEHDSITPVKLSYEAGNGPIQIQIVDPLNVKDGNFILKMYDNTFKIGAARSVSDSALWKIYEVGTTDTIFSERSIKTRNEQLLFSPQNLGMSVLIEQGNVPGVVVDAEPVHSTNGLLGSSISFDNPDNEWLIGISSDDSQSPRDWILSGVNAGEKALYGSLVDDVTGEFKDPDGDFEGILQGTFSPYPLVGYGQGNSTSGILVNKFGESFASVKDSRIEYLNSVVLILTSDKSKWTRCPVIELQEDVNRSINRDAQFAVRTLGSVDKDGNQWQPGMVADVTDPNNPAYIDSIGMGWFPGYAINQETGERYNMAYGEDSWYGVDNGSDMIWNPTSTFNSGVGTTNQVWGGKHGIYIFRKSKESEGLPANVGTFTFDMNNYDSGDRLNTMLTSSALKPFAWRSCSWVGVPLLASNQELLSSDVRIDIQVSRPFEIFDTDVSDIDSTLENNGYPVYQFVTNGVAVQKNVRSVFKDQLERVNIVPNPYYAISEYEVSAVDNLAKIINLPKTCEIRIYNMSGTLIRSYNKSDPANYLDWDLKNHVGIPIASGVYIIHINVPNVGEKILKWFGVMRPVDLNNF